MGSITEEVLGGGYLGTRAIELGTLILRVVVIGYVGGGSGIPEVVGVF